MTAANNIMNIILEGDDDDNNNYNFKIYDDNVVFLARGLTIPINDYDVEDHHELTIGYRDVGPSFGRFMGVNHLLKMTKTLKEFTFDCSDWLYDTETMPPLPFDHILQDGLKDNTSITKFTLVCPPTRCDELQMLSYLDQSTSEYTYENNPTFSLPTLNVPVTLTEFCLQNDRHTDDRYMYISWAIGNLCLLSTSLKVLELDCKFHTWDTDRILYGLLRSRSLTTLKLKGFNECSGMNVMTNLWFDIPTLERIEYNGEFYSSAALLSNATAHERRIKPISLCANYSIIMSSSVLTGLYEMLQAHPEIRLKSISFERLYLSNIDNDDDDAITLLQIKNLKHLYYMNLYGRYLLDYDSSDSNNNNEEGRQQQQQQQQQQQRQQRGNVPLSLWSLILSKASNANNHPSVVYGFLADDRFRKVYFENNINNSPPPPDDDAVGISVSLEDNNSHDDDLKSTTDNNNDNDNIKQQPPQCPCLNCPGHKNIHEFASKMETWLKNYKERK